MQETGHLSAYPYFPPAWLYGIKLFQLPFTCNGSPSQVSFEINNIDDIFNLTLTGSCHQPPSSGKSPSPSCTLPEIDGPHAISSDRRSARPWLLHDHQWRHYL
ncbi:MAG: hypothetical protein ACOYOS_18665, partial [Syntrophales bacterium]